MGIAFLKYLLATAGWESIVPRRENLRPNKSFNLRDHENHIFLNLSGIKYWRGRRSLAFPLPQRGPAASARKFQVTDKKCRIEANESVSIDFRYILITRIRSCRFV